jgi:predicted Zn-dependent protease
MQPSSNPLARLALVVAFGVSACASVPDPEVDRQLGREAAEQVKAGIGIVEDEALNAYLDRVGQRLAASMPQRQFDYRFAVVDQESPNAFAVPGGYVYVSRGLMALMRSEAELAGVLGHEMEHVERRHSVQQMRRDTGLGVLALPGVLLGSVIGEDAAALAAAPFAAASAGYSRDHEREADTLGQQLAASAGYDALGIARVLARMERFLEVSTRRSRQATWFDDHPTTPERVETLTRRAASLAAPARAPIADDAAFVRRLDGLLFGPNPAEGVVRDEVLLHPALGLRVAFPKGWQVDNARHAVTAGAPGEDGVVVLGAVGRGSAADLPKIADAYAAKLAARSGAKPEQSSGTTPAGLPTRTVSLADARGREPLHLDTTWIAFGGTIYQVIGAGPDRYRPQVLEVARSLRPITAGERASITATRLRVVAARRGETVAALAGRAGAAVDVAVVAAMNGLDAATSLSGGEWVKVPVRVPYR